MAPSDSPSSIRAFVSYSHEDDELRRRLNQHLAGLYKQNKILLWDDRQIGPGTEWEGQIDERLEKAELILLLVSASFVASRYCYDVEMTRALERHEANEARVVPVVLRPVDCDGLPFQQLQMLPRDGKAVTLWTNRDEAFTDVARGDSQGGRRSPAQWPAAARRGANSRAASAR